MENKLAELKEAIDNSFESFNTNYNAFVEKKNNAAAVRVRKISVQIEKLFKQLRSLTLEIEKEGYK